MRTRAEASRQRWAIFAFAVAILLLSFVLLKSAYYQLVLTQVLLWAVLSLVSEVTPLGYWLDATLPVYLYSVTWLLAGAPSIGFAVLLFVLSSGLRRGRAGNVPLPWEHPGK